MTAPTLAEAMAAAFDRAHARGRDDLIADAIDDLWLIFRFPTDDRFPDGPPEAALQSVARSKGRRREAIEVAT